MNYAAQTVTVYQDGERKEVPLAEYMAHVVEWAKAGGQIQLHRTRQDQAIAFRLPNVIAVSPMMPWDRLSQELMSERAAVEWNQKEGIILWVPRGIPLKIEFDVMALK